MDQADEGITCYAHIKAVWIQDVMCGLVRIFVRRLVCVDIRFRYIVNKNVLLIDQRIRFLSHYFNQDGHSPKNIHNSKDSNDNKRTGTPNLILPKPKQKMQIASTKFGQCPECRIFQTGSETI